ncbi:MAG TPA: hypothetical protein VM779_16045, partial [Thermoanaerobaculia bacterium]|nr:hypothetical protein [Thermoanaerobaculia bacterium]
LDDKWLTSHLKENPNALRHEWIGKELLITASTAELQAFLLRHVSTKGAFAPTPGEWRRAG